MEYRARYRSLFWPVILIGVGAMWLLSNLGYVTPANLFEIWRLWPLLLIAAGLDMLLGRRLPLASALIGLLVLGLVGAFLFADIRIPGRIQTAVVTERVHLPVDQAKTANISLDFWSDPVRVFALSDSPELIDAQITHTGRIDFRGSGQAEKTIHLSHEGTFNQGFFWLDGANRRADVGLTPAIPLDLSIHTASGSSEMDLSGLQLSRLAMDSGSGSIRVTLPASKAAYDASFSTGSGSIDLTIPGEANATLQLDSGSGSVNVRVKGNPALRIEIQDNGSGSVNLPSGLVKTASGSGDQGTWETPGFENALSKIEITVVNFGSGSLNINN